MGENSSQQWPTIWMVVRVVGVAIAVLAVVGTNLGTKFRTDALWDWKSEQKAESIIQDAQIKALELLTKGHTVSLLAVQDDIAEIKRDLKTVEQDTKEILRRIPQ